MPHTAALQARLEAGARHERTLFAVAWMPLLGPQQLRRHTSNRNSRSGAASSNPCHTGT